MRGEGWLLRIEREGRTLDICVDTSMREHLDAPWRSLALIFPPSSCKPMGEEGGLQALEGIISACREAMRREQEIYESRGFLEALVDREREEELAEVRNAAELCIMLFGKELMVRLARGRRAVIDYVPGSPQERRLRSLARIDQRLRSFLERSRG
ncbi:MAG: hypothetical protein NZ902_03685 [Acidilobaceae archaeon]|nr:hypothetical protein [Acidilobaceae archaeon]MCX8165169.1 hypothetical protein [Acidilobaceae archaeon]MDW7974315.1 hypothetical protein [Sulfolobales archaeon]